MSDLLWEGLNLALFGMGFVFIFLIVLVFLTGAMSSLVRQFSPLTVGVDGSNQT
ncbi:MAG: OadG family protein [Pseudohongiella nitratireducens]|nr:OadG family protein [Pseudohongiella nitratireducens]MDF1623070.1 OadG family protein [Pseudohongiella nitratireducens]